jgi:hypothetical protein
MTDTNRLSVPMASWGKPVELAHDLGVVPVVTGALVCIGDTCYRQPTSDVVVHAATATSITVTMGSAGLIDSLGRNYGTALTGSYILIAPAVAAVVAEPKSKKVDPKPEPKPELIVTHKPEPKPEPKPVAPVKHSGDASKRKHR